MSFEDAIYRAVHAHPGGVKALAARMGLAPSTLQNMANPNQHGHGWNWARVREVLHFSERSVAQQVVGEFCQEFGGVFVPLPADSLASDEALLDLVTRHAKEYGEAMAKLGEALADGRVTAKEFDGVKQAFAEELVAAHQILGRLEQLVEKRPVLKVAGKG